MRKTLFAAALAAAAVAGVAMAQEETRGKEGLAAGDRAPDFRLNDQDGHARRLADLAKERWVVLAFFPKAMTPG